MSRTRTAGPFPIHPFLFALYPSLFLYAYNIEETGLGTVWGPMAASLGLIAVVFLIAWLLAKQVRKAALIALVFALLFFSYGHVFNLFKKPPAWLGWIQTGVWTALLAGSILLIVRLRKDPVLATRLLNIFGAVLVFLSASQIVWSHLAATKTGDGLPIDPQDQAILENRIKPTPGYLPDIYYLIFDRYAGPDILERYYGFDNGPFLEELRKRHFSTSSDSRCNYPGTYLSLTSTLNMENIDKLFPKFPIRKREIYHRLQDHRVGRLLKALGYTYYHIGSWYEGTKRNPYADNEFRPSGLTSLSQDFLLKFADSTWFNVVMRGGGRVSRNYQHREGVRQQFDRLVYVAKRSGPKFVFLHMLVPHSPFVFGPNGEEVVKDPARGPAARYLDQVIYINKRILEMIRAIRGAPKPPVIIIQADEGPAEEEAPRAAFARLMGKQRQMARAQVRYSIMNSWSFPKGIPGEIPPGTSSINTFPIVFNRCFGTNYRLLPDHSFRFVQTKKTLKSVKVLPQTDFEFTKQISDLLKN